MLRYSRQAKVIDLKDHSPKTPQTIFFPSSYSATSQLMGFEEARKRQAVLMRSPRREAAFEKKIYIPARNVSRRGGKVKASESARMVGEEGLEASSAQSHSRGFERDLRK